MSPGPVLAQAQNALFRWGWVADNIDTISGRLVQHVQLTGMAMALGIGVALVLSAVALRWPRLYGPIAATSGVLYTIPSLATFVLLLPIFGGLLEGRWTASVLALASYTLLILVRNIVTGVRGVPDDVRRAATGMGYRRHQLLFRIELPLALPTIIAGLRIATVTVIGLVTVTALLGLGGLGHFILDGLQRRFPTEVLVGIGASVLLATALDFLLLSLSWALTPWMRRA